MRDDLNTTVEAGDFIAHVDTRNSHITLGVLQGDVTKKGRPYFVAYQSYDKTPKKVCASNYYMIFKITEEQLRAKGNPNEIESLLEVKETFNR